MEIEIDNKFWGIENLDIVKFQNGDDIFEAQTLEEWAKAGEDKIAAWCNPEHLPEGELKYGKLYNYYAVEDPRGLAPDGWAIPSKDDLEDLQKSTNNKHSLFQLRTYKNTINYLNLQRKEKMT